MANVYDKLREFYLNNDEAKFLFQEKVFERHLRKCAWNGDSDELLNLRFELFSKMVLSAIDIDIDSIYDLIPEDYLEIFYELADFENKKLNENLALKYLKILEDLFLEKESNGFDGKIAEIEFIRMFFYDDGNFHLLKKEKLNGYKNQIRRGKTSYEESKQIEFLKKNWLNKIQEYFSDDIFEKDIERAEKFFCLDGDKSKINKKNNDDFRDYFLFDYRLLKTDETPLEFFYNSEKDSLDETSLEIIEEYLNSKFTIFFVKREDDIFLCRDFFREREFYIPYSSEDFPEYKNTLFISHIDYGSIVNPIYFTAISASKKDQDSIICEIEKAYKLYGYQEKNPTYTKFFSRHNIAIRKIISKIISKYKIDIIPEASNIEFIKTNPIIFEDYEGAFNKLINIGRSLDFSEYSLKLLKKYYHDFLLESDFTRWQNESETILFAILANFIKMNDETVDYETIPFNINGEKMQYAINKINDLLNGEKFDPRYLSEEGFLRLVCL